MLIRLLISEGNTPNAMIQTMPYRFTVAFGETEFLQKFTILNNKIFFNNQKKKKKTAKEEKETAYSDHSAT